MPRGNEQQVKVHYKGKSDDFVIFVESAEAVKQWKGDSSIPLAQVVNGWKVFVTHKYADAFSILSNRPCYEGGHHWP